MTEPAPMYQKIKYGVQNREEGVVVMLGDDETAEDARRTAAMFNASGHAVFIPVRRIIMISEWEALPVNNEQPLRGGITG